MQPPCWGLAVLRGQGCVCSGPSCRGPHWGPLGPVSWLATLPVSPGVLRMSWGQLPRPQHGPKLRAPYRAYVGFGAAVSGRLLSRELGGGSSGHVGEPVCVKQTWVECSVL